MLAGYGTIEHCYMILELVSKHTIDRTLSNTQLQACAAIFLEYTALITAADMFWIRSDFDRNVGAGVLAEVCCNFLMAKPVTEHWDTQYAPILMLGGCQAFTRAAHRHGVLKDDDW